ncbi:MAG: hypothetical protein ABJC66_00980 [Gammaproteobacteria bacterium]
MCRIALMLLLCGQLGGIATAAATAATHAPQAAARTAAEVIERNVAARGGLQAWRKVNTMVWLGHLERAGSKEGQQIPFAMQLKRPNLTRFELKQQFDHFTRIFDGNHGWKVRPASDGRPETKSFSPAEVTFAQTEYVIDGPLIDYQIKGVTAALDGLDSVDGRKAYRLSLKLPSGAERKLWIDAATYLEIRMDRPATNPLVAGKPVSMYYRDYRAEDGLQIPHTVETRASSDQSGAESADRLVIDRVIVNSTLDDNTFMPPAVPLRHGGPTHPAGGPSGMPGMPGGMTGRPGTPGGTNP